MKTSYRKHITSPGMSSAYSCFLSPLPESSLIRIRDLLSSRIYVLGLQDPGIRIWELEFQFPCSIFAGGNYNFDSHGAFLHVGIRISIPKQRFCMWELELQFPCSVFAYGNWNFNSHAEFFCMWGF